MEYAIKGFNPSTFIDWEGKLSSVIYLPGCNFRCPFCHSSSLVTEPQELPDVPFDHIVKFFSEKKGWIEAVVIGGGEPTLNKNLCPLLTELKKNELLVKVDTNGSNPDVIRDLIDYNLADYIAMDIKAPLEQSRYEKAVGTAVDIMSIRESIAILLASKIDYEFRTTVVPSFINREDILNIAESIGGAKRYVLQQFEAKETLDKDLSQIKPYSIGELKIMSKLAGEHVKNCFLRGI
ncbi:MAG: anaerobic ribonucleoside-triphosphate reductase activating protein [PVC group bacterium]|nr:anaerobic ribonucleoside-triphosphate reductase activating protein [PVC group bacterium]